MSIVLELKKEDYQKIVAHCELGLPEEACGLLAGEITDEKKIVKEVYLLTNIDHSKEHFSMDPREQFHAVKDARRKGLAMIGNFHSHPESPSRPSEEDKRLAYDSMAEYFILSLQDRENPVLKAFGIDSEKNVTIHKIEIIG